jgi:hypothetical protein
MAGMELAANTPLGSRRYTDLHGQAQRLASFNSVAVGGLAGLQRVRTEEFAIVRDREAAASTALRRATRFLVRICAPSTGLNLSLIRSR